MGIPDASVRQSCEGILDIKRLELPKSRSFSPRPESAPAEGRQPAQQPEEIESALSTSAACAGAASERTIATKPTRIPARHRSNREWRCHRLHLAGPARAGPHPRRRERQSRRVNIFKKRRKNDGQGGGAHAGGCRIGAFSVARTIPPLCCRPGGGVRWRRSTACCPSSMGSYAA